jgi:hypothetical protein
VLITQNPNSQPVIPIPPSDLSRVVAEPSKGGMQESEVFAEVKSDTVIVPEVMVKAGEQELEEERFVSGQSLSDVEVEVEEEEEEEEGEWEATEDWTDWFNFQWDSTMPDPDPITTTTTTTEAHVFSSLDDWAALSASLTDVTDNDWDTVVDNWRDVEVLGEERQEEEEDDPQEASGAESPPEAVPAPVGGAPSGEYRNPPPPVDLSDSEDEVAEGNNSLR